MTNTVSCVVFLPVDGRDSYVFAKGSFPLQKVFFQDYMPRGHRLGFGCVLQANRTCNQDPCVWPSHLLVRVLLW